MMVDLERELGVPSQKKAVERRHGARCQWRNDMESTFFFLFFSVCNGLFNCICVRGGRTDGQTEKAQQLG